MKIENVRTAQGQFSAHQRSAPERLGYYHQEWQAMCRADANNGRHRPGGSGAISDQNKRFWKIIDAAIARGNAAGFTDLDDLDSPVSRNPTQAPGVRISEGD